MLLVHACCGPCSITVMQALAGRGLELRAYFYNPNIHPLTEYLRRREGLEVVAARLGVPADCADAEYDPAAFLRLAAFRESDRCRHCWRLRLERSARQARALGAQGFTTTLLYSKYQDHDTVAAIGREAGQEHGVDFLYEDFRTGWDEGIRLSKEWGIYRQPYCGCVFSEFERYRKRLGRPGGIGQRPGQ